MTLARQTLFSLIFLSFGSVAFGSQRQFVHQDGKRNIWISQKVRADTGYRRQLIVEGRRSEIRIDENGDGAIDQLEISDGPFTAQAWLPLDGQFTRLDFSRREKRGIRHLHFMLGSGGKAFRLVSQEFQPYETLFRYEELMIGPICEDPNNPTEKLVQDWRNVLDSLLQAGGAEASLIKRLLDPKDPILHESCKNGAFKEAAPAIAKGLAQMMLSAKQPDNKASMYLKCLEDNELGVHAARIEKAFFQSSQGPKPLVKCVHWADKNQHGSWKEGIHGNEIFLHQPKYEPHQCRGNDPANMYGESLLHELLHDSGIKDEVTVKTIQSCCGRGESGSCGKLKTLIGQEKLNRSYDSAYTKKFDQKYSMLRAQILEMSSSTARGQDFLDDYFKGLDKAFARAIEAKEKCGLNVDCETKFQQAMKTFNNQFFAGKCAYYFNSPEGKRTQKACTQFREEFEALVMTSEDSQELYSRVRDPLKQAEGIIANFVDTGGGSQARLAEAATNHPTNLQSPPSSPVIPIVFSDDPADIPQEFGGHTPKGGQPIQTSVSHSGSPAPVYGFAGSASSEVVTAPSSASVTETNASQPYRAALAKAPTPERRIPVKLENTRETKKIVKDFDTTEGLMEAAAETFSDLMVPRASASPLQSASSSAPRPPVPEMNLPNPFIRDPAGSAEGTAGNAKTVRPQSEGPNVKEGPEMAQLARGSAAPSPRKVSSPETATPDPMPWSSQTEFIDFMIGPYSNALKVLSRADLPKVLSKYWVKVTDSAGSVHGPVNADVHLEYRSSSHKLERK
jgi:hypothetical protein